MRTSEECLVMLHVLKRERADLAKISKAKRTANPVLMLDQQVLDLQISLLEWVLQVNETFKG